MVDHPRQIDPSIERVFRREHGRIIATLIRHCRSFDLAEEAMQEAFVSALVDWKAHGVPDSPGAWITSAARRKLIDLMRRDRTRRNKADALTYEIGLRMSEDDMNAEPPERRDPDRLRLIFTCCHPALNREAQIALTLRTLGGLSTDDIARAFLIAEPTLAQRLVRARRKILQARIPYEIPPESALAERLAAVQAVIYLIFNEGYLARTGDHLIRLDLCNEAIRLGEMLCELRPRDAESLSLLALMLLHDSRRAARIDAEGALITLERQNRSLWDYEQIDRGLTLVERADPSQPGPYHLQASIAALHAVASNAAYTDWAQIAELYAELERIQPTPVVTLNRAAAIGMAHGPAAGLAIIDQVAKRAELQGYYLLYAARADLLRRAGNLTDAAEAYGRAIALTENTAERHYLEKRLSELKAM